MHHYNYSCYIICRLCVLGVEFMDRDYPQDHPQLSSEKHRSTWGQDWKRSGCPCSWRHWSLNKGTWQRDRKVDDQVSLQQLEWGYIGASHRISLNGVLQVGELSWMTNSREAILFRRALLDNLTCANFIQYLAIKQEPEQFLVNNVLFWLEVQRYKVYTLFVFKSWCLAIIQIMCYIWTLKLLQD